MRVTNGVDTMLVLDVARSDFPHLGRCQRKCGSTDRHGAELPEPEVHFVQLKKSLKQTLKQSLKLANTF